MIRKYILPCAVVILLINELAWSNFTYPPKYRMRSSTSTQDMQGAFISNETFPVELFSVVIEALLFAIILNYLGFDPQKIFCIWLPITFVTIMLLDMFILSSAFIFKWRSTVEIIRETNWFGTWAITIGIGEFLVILYEALALRIISLSTFFYRTRSVPLKPRHALILSATVNLGLLLIGLLIYYFYDYTKN